MQTEGIALETEIWQTVWTILAGPNWTETFGSSHELHFYQFMAANMNFQSDCIWQLVWASECLGVSWRCCDLNLQSLPKNLRIIEAYASFKEEEVVNYGQAHEGRIILLSEMVPHTTASLFSAKVKVRSRLFDCPNRNHTFCACAPVFLFLLEKWKTRCHDRNVFVESVQAQ